MSERLAEAFADGPAFVPYLAAGDPDVESTKAYVRALVRGGADVVELGLPFSEPIAEGPTIQGAVVRALEGGMTPERYLELVADLDADPEVDVALVCMTYYNLIYRYGDAEGPAPFVRAAAEAGVDGFVVPDLPAEEAGPLRTACDEFGLDLVSIVAPTTGEERLDRLMALTSGYVYVQARLGVTGARDDVSDRTEASLGRLEAWDVPRAVGFGVKTGDHAERIVAAGADGVIVGSALVDIVAEGVENGDDADAVAQRLEAKARELTAGVERGAERREQGRPHPERT
jgi:tryptophan synthase alpha chain